jgi:type VI secretion system protein ImpM
MPEEVVSAMVPGWFGKLPNLGDFASRRLPPTFIGPWDEWLQHGLAAAREALGPRWLDVYLVAPVRRFCIAADVIDAHPWTGILMPSVDRVGRHFPLTLTLPSLRADAAWYAAIDDVARRVLDVNYSADDLEQALREVPAAQSGGTVEAGSVWWCGEAIVARRVPGLPPPEAFASLLVEAEVA